MLNKAVTRSYDGEVNENGYRVVNEVTLNVTNKDVSQVFLLGYFSQEDYDAGRPHQADEVIKIDAQYYDQFFSFDVLAENGLLGQIEKYLKFVWIFN